MLNMFCEQRSVREILYMCQEVHDKCFIYKYIQVDI